MREVLITGAAGEVGQGLIRCLSQRKDLKVVAVDLNGVAPELASMCSSVIKGDLLNPLLLSRLKDEFCFDTIFHLAGLLSSGAERSPFLAHRVNTDIAISLMELAAHHKTELGKRVRFIFPSTIAAYGVEADVNTPVKENQYLSPITAYGINKLYVEQFGVYASENFNLLDAEQEPPIDFRCLRYPGLLSAETVPSSGTSDYGPEMLHYAAQGKEYTCFVTEDTQIPFMSMPDAIRAIVMLAEAEPETLSQRVYNVGSFSITAGGIRDYVLKIFPDAKIGFESHQAKQRIVNSWPRDIDYSKAREDFGFVPEMDAEQCFLEYLAQGVCRRYQVEESLAAN